MDSTIFQEYATDLDSLVQGIIDKLEGTAAKLKGGEPLIPSSLEYLLHGPDHLLRRSTEERNAVFRRIERELEEADEIV